MSGSSYTDKEGKRMKHSDVQQEDVSKERNASSSTPTETTATDAAKPSGEGTVDLPFHTYIDQDSSETVNQQQQDTTASSTKVGEFKRGKFLFELQLTAFDVEEGRLFIPGEEAACHLPTGTPQNNHIEEIEISSTRNNEDWHSKLLYFHQNDSFLIANGWQEFIIRHKLETRDVIRFYRPVPRSHNNHFLIEYVKREEAKTHNIPEFKQENFLFDLQLAPNDVTSGCFIIPKEEVRKHFPAIQVPEAAPRPERLKFTDAQGKDWWMKIIFNRNGDGYLIVNGWEEFVEEVNLEAMDVIKFYKPVRPSHARHFLIDYLKKGEAGTSMPQSGSATNDGNSERPAHSGGSYKGKEIAPG